MLSRKKIELGIFKNLKQTCFLMLNVYLNYYFSGKYLEISETVRVVCEIVEKRYRCEAFQSSFFPTTKL